MELFAAQYPIAILVHLVEPRARTLQLLLELRALLRRKVARGLQPGGKPQQLEDFARAGTFRAVVPGREGVWVFPGVCRGGGPRPLVRCALEGRSAQVVLVADLSLTGGHRPGARVPPLLRVAADGGARLLQQPEQREHGVRMPVQLIRHATQMLFAVLFDFGHAFREGLNQSVAAVLHQLTRAGGHARPGVEPLECVHLGLELGERGLVPRVLVLLHSRAHHRQHLGLARCGRRQPIRSRLAAPEVVRHGVDDVVDIGQRGLRALTATARRLLRPLRLL